MTFINPLSGMDEDDAARFDDPAVSPSSRDLLAVLIPLLALSFGPSPSPPLYVLVLQLKRLNGLRGLTLDEGQDRV